MRKSGPQISDRYSKNRCKFMENIRTFHKGGKAENGQELKFLGLIKIEKTAQIAESMRFFDLFCKKTLFLL